MRVPFSCEADGGIQGGGVCGRGAGGSPSGGGSAFGTVVLAKGSGYCRSQSFWGPAANVDLDGKTRDRGRRVCAFACETVGGVAGLGVIFRRFVGRVQSVDRLEVGVVVWVQGIGDVARPPSLGCRLRQGFGWQERRTGGDGCVSFARKTFGRVLGVEGGTVAGARAGVGAAADWRPGRLSGCESARWVLKGLWRLSGWWRDRERGGWKGRRAREWLRPCGQPT